jgi:vacuolar-type H+-ATPase subunit E/Vma4
LNTWGGLIAASADGRVVVINTLEARLEQALPFLRRHLAAYFEEEKAAVVEYTSTHGI